MKSLKNISFSCFVVIVSGCMAEPNPYNPNDAKDIVSMKDCDAYINYSMTDPYVDRSRCLRDLDKKLMVSEYEIRYLMRSKNYQAYSSDPEVRTVIDLYKSDGLFSRDEIYKIHLLVNTKAADLASN